MGTDELGDEEPGAEEEISVEDMIKGMPDILTQIIDNTSFTVGGETYEEGDVVNLADEERLMLGEIKRINNENKALKQWLLDKCHATERKLIPEIRPAAHTLALNSIRMREGVSILINKMHSRLGGMLPLKLDDDLSEFKVRAVSPQENLNYTVSRVLDLVGINELLHQREFSFSISQERADSRIDMSQNNRYQFQPIIVMDFMQEDEEDKPTFETRLIAGLTEFLKKHPRPSKTLVMLDTDLAHIINLQIQKPGRWEKIVEYAEAMEPHIIYVIEAVPGKDTTKSDVILSCMFMDKEQILVKKTWKFQVRVQDKRVKEIAQTEGEFHSKPEEQYEDLLAS
jgi:hypothetical protein